MQAFINEYGGQILTKSAEHIYISALALALGILVAVPLGIVLTRFQKISSFVIGLASVLQTVPSLALLALMIPFFGVGKLPAVIALFIYSLLPILRNTYIGMKNVDWNYRDVAKGMGMTNLQSIFFCRITDCHANHHGWDSFSRNLCYRLGDFGFIYRCRWLGRLNL